MAVIFIIVLIGLLQWNFSLATVQCGFNPCLNGGTCVPNTNGSDFTCICFDNFIGAVCEQDAPTTPPPTTTTTSDAITSTTAATTTTNRLPHQCAFNPCHNGGYCTAMGGGYECFCPSTHTGVLCQTLSNSSALPSLPISARECPFNPCQNGGFCVSAGSDYKCYCPSTHSGATCEILVTPKPVTQETSTTEFVFFFPSESTTASPTMITTTTAPPSITSSSVCQADIQFLLDTSGSLSQLDFKDQLNFVGNLVRSLFAHQHDVRIGVATFSSFVKNEFHLNAYTKERDIIAAINRTHYTSGQTLTDLGLKYAHNVAMTTAHGARDGVPHVLIVITDGSSTIPAATIQEADAVHQANITVLAVGVGNSIDRAELNLIATDLSHVFTVSDYGALTNVETDLIQTSCGFTAP